MRMTRPRPYVLAIIQARLGSERLPGKMLRKIGGKSVLEHVISRAKDAEGVHSVVVATPDKRISDLADARGVFGFWYRGDPMDVLSRFVRAGEFDNCDVVVRITGDCPLIPSEVISETIEGLGTADICSNVLNRTYPKGFDCEVFHRDVLYRLDRLAMDPVDREHVTLYAYKHPEQFVWNECRYRTCLSDYDLSVDTEGDLEFVREVYKLAQPDVDAASIMKVLDERL